MPLMRPSYIGLIVLVVLLAACSRPDTAPTKPAAGNAAPAGIAWKYAASDADVDAAFAQARQDGKPLFLYWGAKWCPPCNQLSATLFNRSDFIERSRAFAPVYIDGDSPGAQKLGARFKVRGYPTMVMFNPQGIELTRLPGEVDANLYTQVLTMSMNAQRPVRAVLADARAGAKGLSANDWRLLAFYSWETDEQQVVAKAELPAALTQIAAACPAEHVQASIRLLLKALAAAPKGTPADPAMRERVLAVIADATTARTHMDVLGNNASELVSALSAPGTAQRSQLLAAFEATLRRLETDPALSRADRLTALFARVELARIDAPKDSPVVLPAALLAQLHEHIARADREITDGYERQAVIPFAAYVLQQADLLDESDALLQGNLAKSHSPYYLMSELAGNAKKRGDKVGALRWAEQAFDTSVGAATRLQWGASYIGSLVELTPLDEGRIEKAAMRLLDEAAAQPDVFYERSARSLQRVSSRLLGWNKDGSHAAVLRRLQTRVDTLCAALPVGDAQRAVCEVLLKPDRLPERNHG
ncbi:MAG: thioredoxin family protein [Burkholderiaceae bacterium]